MNGENKMLNKIINGDCLEVMKTFDSEIIDLTVTSPPYDDLRKYKGYSFDFEGIAKELYRITKVGGVVVWVVGDATKNFCESLTSFKQAIFFVEECGFNLLDTMIYAKKNYAPAYPSMRRYAQTFEYMFVFSKGKPKTFNPIQTEKSQRFSQSESCGFRQKDGTIKRKKIKSLNNLKNECNVWSYAVGGANTTKDKIAFGHPAIFPEQLAKDHIKSWSNEGDLILDPMAGSGTTLKMAKELNRNYIGIEMSSEYCKISEERIKNHKIQGEML